MMLRRSIYCRFMIIKWFYYVHFPPLRICEGRKKGKEGEVKMRRVSLGSFSSEICEFFRTVGEAFFFFFPLEFLIGNRAHLQCYFFMKHHT